MKLPPTTFIKLTEDTQRSILTKLNAAYASEWLAYYQYWVGAYTTPDADLADLLREHARDEMKHATWLANRITELGGRPILEFSQLEQKSPCEYMAPRDADKLIGQNITGEDCAIKVYQDLMALSKDTDAVTYKLVSKILLEETDHKNELEAIKS